MLIPYRSRNVNQIVKGFCTPWTGRKRETTELWPRGVPLHYLSQTLNLNSQVIYHLKHFHYCFPLFSLSHYFHSFLTSVSYIFYLPLARIPVAILHYNYALIILCKMFITLYVLCFHNGLIISAHYLTRVFFNFNSHICCIIIHKLLMYRRRRRPQIFPLAFVCSVVITSLKVFLIISHEFFYLLANQKPRHN